MCFIDREESRKLSPQINFLGVEVVAKWIGFKNPSFTGRSSIRGNANFRGGHGFGTTFRQFFGSGVRAGLVPWDDENVHWFFTCTSLLELQMFYHREPQNWF
ncbi:hypothetical protein V6N12_048291 [Hibiscus sabdariffa]|uniref:Uncharacterized protein n=1 Tax=Hibiscus sabdariffa TaxID=183260 RepID=A0ABR2EGW1_9ROSI